MSDKIHQAGFDHPCRQTCSGWQQGFDRGRGETSIEPKITADLSYIAAAESEKEALRKERDDLEKTIHKAIDIHTTAILEIVKLTKERDDYHEVLKKLAVIEMPDHPVKGSDFAEYTINRKCRQATEVLAKYPKEKA